MSLFKKKRQVPGDAARVAQHAWQVLVVDDEPQVHVITKLALSDMEYLGRRLQVTSAFSATEACSVMQGLHDLALIILDVVMESDNAGLELVNHIRREKGDLAVRILLRTGQPGQAPERQVIRDYDINDYLNKSSLTADKLYTVTLASLRSYDEIRRRDVATQALREQHLQAEKSAQELAQAQTQLLQYQTRLEELVESRTQQLRATMQDLEKAKLLAEQAAEAKADFLANMSHEIRTPMNAIIGLTHMALKLELPAKLRDYLSKIHHSGRHLLGVINDILDYSKIEAGKLVLERTEFSLDSVLETVVNLVQEKVNSKNLEFICEVAPNVPRSLVGDPLRLGQALINLASNAVKFTERGEVSIGVSVQAEWPQTDELVLYFLVSDSGIGMSAANMQKLFRSFSQADTSTSRSFGGTGLGLAISKNLIEQMGGQVGVESELGVGTQFWFTARLGVGAHQAPRLMPQPDLLGARILVVDDNAHARAVMVSVLKELAFVPEAATSGADGLAEIERAQAAGQPYQAVIWDWQMPHMSGIEAARALAQRALPQMPKQLLLTAYGREEFSTEGSHDAIDGVLFKPISMHLVLDILSACLSNTKGAQSALRAGFDREVMPSDQLLLQRLRPYAGMRILLVEDNALNQQVATELLRDAAFDVTVAEDGERAVQMVQSQAFALVLMDMQMPVMDGLAATRAIRALGPFAQLPIVAMTANAMQQDRERCIASGMNDFVAKPIEPPSLWEALLRWLPEPTVVPHPVAPPTRARPQPVDLEFSLPGLDSVGALQRVAGNAQLYLKLLNTFANERGRLIADIEQAALAQDWPLAERLAHTLKGTAGNLGLVQVEPVAAQLERVFSAASSPTAQADWPTLLRGCAQQMEDVVQGLERQWPSEGATLASASDVGSNPALLADMCQLLKQDDASALELLEGNRASLHVRLGSGFAAFEVAVQNFQFDLALELLTNQS